MHSVVMENRRRLAVSCCEEVVSLNENEIVLSCEDSSIVIKGAGLSVEEVSRQSGDVIVTAYIIDSIVYQKGHKKSREGIFRRIVK